MKKVARKPKILKTKIKLIELIKKYPKLFRFMHYSDIRSLYYHRGYFMIADESFYYYFQHYIRTYPRVDFILIHKTKEYGKVGLMQPRQITKTKVVELLECAREIVNG